MKSNDLYHLLRFLARLSEQNSYLQSQIFEFKHKLSQIQRKSQKSPVKLMLSQDSNF